MNKKISVALVVVAIFLFNGLTLPFCNNSETTTETSPEPSPTATLNDAPLATVDASVYDPELTANYEAANTAAQEWNQDAKLAMVSVKLPQDLSVNNSTETYTYGSENAPYYWWTYSLSESTGKIVRALVNKEDYLGTDIQSIPLSYWRTNYIEAFQIADNYGGKEFRQNNQNVTVSLTLSVGQPKNWLWWLVEYKTPIGESFNIRINPNDQTIVDESGEVVTTGSAYSPTTSTITDTTDTTIVTTPTPGVTATEEYIDQTSVSTTTTPTITAF